MKLPAYLVRTSYGYAFRLRVPRDLLPHLPAGSVKRSLRGYTLREAQLCALTLAGRYARLFQELRRESSGMADKKSLLETALEGARGGKHFEIGADPATGRPTFKSTPDDTPASLALGLSAFQTAQAAFSPAPAQAPAYAPKLKPITVKQAGSDYLFSIMTKTKPKTLTIIAAAVNGFTAHFLKTVKDPKTQLQDTGSTSVAHWVQMLNNQKLAPNTVNNKAGHVARFYAWAMASGYYPKGANPGEGHTTFSKKQQQERLKQGYRAFSAEEILTLFDPAHFKSLGAEARWGVVIGLYTGARVSEVGQLRISDFGIYENGRLQEDGLLPVSHQPKGEEGKDWVYALRFTDEGPGQSLKTADSRRDIFIHPDLVALGIIDRVKTLTATGQDCFFPAVKIGNVNGAGNWLSKAFSAYRTKRKVIVDAGSTRKLGFHSFRKTATQAMQRLGVDKEYRERYLGHEMATVQEMVYAAYAPTMLYQHIGRLSFGIDLDGLRPLLAKSKLMGK